MKRILVFALLVSAIAMQVNAAGGKKQVRLKVTEISTAIFDETSINLDLGNRQYIFPEDGEKIFDTSSSAPSLYSFSGDMVPCFSNSYGNFTPATVISLGLRAKGNGIYTIRATLLDNFDPTSIIRLEDRTLNTFHDLRNGDYIFLLNQVTHDDGRFFLHISYPAEITTIDAGCSNADGVISISQDNSITWNTVTLYNDSAQVVYTTQNQTDNFTFATLPYGNYHIAFSYNGYTANDEAYVNGWSIENEVTAATIYGSVGQNMQFFSTSTHTADYLWDFGDGSQIDGIANPGYAYTQPGTYTVTLTSSNSHGCSNSSTITVYISETTGVETISANDVHINLQNRSLQILFNKQITSGYSVQLFNTVGQSILQMPLTQTETNIQLGNIPAGVYVARVANSNGAFTKKISVN